MENNGYAYLKRDISWLSFNHRVLLEAEDERLPVYERIKFLSIYSSNLEEYYKVRVAGYHSSLLDRIKRDETAEEALQTLAEIKEIVTHHEEEYTQIFNEMILPDLERNKIILYRTEKVKPFHRAFIEKYFREEVFPYLQPMIIRKDDIHMFIQDGRIYQAIILSAKEKTAQACSKQTADGAASSHAVACSEGVSTPDGAAVAAGMSGLPDGQRDCLEQEGDGLSLPPYTYALLKIPYTRVPRFIELPEHEGTFYIMFIDDVIKANLKNIFPGFDIIGCYSIKISRDADFTLENEDPKDIAERILREVRKRKIGAVTRFQYDRSMPEFFLKYLMEAYEIEDEELLPSAKYLNLADLSDLPNPVGDRLRQQLPPPLQVSVLEQERSLFRVLRREDVLLHFPYQSFDYFLRFLLQAAFDPKVREIKVTQYRVAENSAVVSSLISAAKNGKKVTVFVELKARFDEENNYISSELMQQSGIKIIYSLPGLKVHTKLAYVRKYGREPDNPIKGYAYLGTGNFNEKTARIYSDVGLLTSDREILEDIDELFRILEGAPHLHDFKHLLIAQYNMVSEINRMIEREIEQVKNGGKGHIILKMNSLEDKGMINALYRAGTEGVRIELIIRGICCLVPNQPYSRNITVTRIVDAYLEHARAWYFYNGGAEEVYLSSADWMERNLHRRIEAAFPIHSPALKRQIIDILHIQLADNRSAVWVDERMCNIFKQDDKPPIRAQQAIYDYLKRTAGR